MCIFLLPSYIILHFYPFCNIIFKKRKTLFPESMCFITYFVTIYNMISSIFKVYLLLFILLHLCYVYCFVFLRHYYIIHIFFMQHIFTYFDTYYNLFVLPNPPNLFFSIETSSDTVKYFINIP